MFPVVRFRAEWNIIIQIVPMKTLQSLHAQFSVINESFKFGLHYDNKGYRVCST